MWKQRLSERLANEPGLVAAYVFGSQGRGAAKEHSDVDVGIWLETKPTRFEDARFALARELEELIGKPVDLVIMSSASPDLVHRILRDGDLVVERDRSRRIRFEVQARNEYFDTQPPRDAYRRAAPARRLRSICRVDSPQVGGDFAVVAGANRRSAGQRRSRRSS